MAFEELKERQAAMWGSAPFENIAPALADMYEAIIGAVGAQPGDRWLDVGCGTGELAFLAAETGADVRGLRPRAETSSPPPCGRRRSAALDIPFEVGRLRGAALRRRELRHRHVVGRRDLRAGSRARSPPSLRASPRPAVASR